jgi:hypothetical protein
VAPQQLQYYVVGQLYLAAPIGGGRCGEEFVGGEGGGDEQGGVGKVLDCSSCLPASPQ